MIDEIFVAEESAGPMQAVSSAKTFAGRGIVGDRYFARKGTFSVFRSSTKQAGKREPGRQLTLLAAEGVEQALMMNGIKALDSLGDLRRNVVLRGVPTAELQGAVGREITLGKECQVFVHRQCKPTEYIERFTAREGLMEAAWECAGVHCEVVRSGTIRVGDTVSISSEVQPDRVDSGEAAGQAEYLIPPSKRSRRQREKLRTARSNALPHLLKVEPGGVVRALEAHQVLGLKLFKPPKRFRKGEATTERFCLMVVSGILLVHTRAARITPAALPTPLCSRAPRVSSSFSSSSSAVSRSSRFGIMINRSCCALACPTG